MKALKKKNTEILFQIKAERNFFNKTVTLLSKSVSFILPDSFNQVE